jgi:hypothetical protein
LDSVYMLWDVAKPTPTTPRTTSKIITVTIGTEDRR